jgi:hypothetical protein
VGGYVKRIQVPLFQTHGVARGEFNTPPFTSGSLLYETKYSRRNPLKGAKEQGWNYAVHFVIYTESFFLQVLNFEEHLLM